MDERKATVGIVFLMALSLSLGVQQAASTCSPVNRSIPVAADVSQSPVRVPCISAHSTSIWTIGSDLCDRPGFVLYERCSMGTGRCFVDSSDFLKRGPTYVCCGENECSELMIAPVVNSVIAPPVVQAGKEETVYTTITVKPLPDNLPSLTVSLMHLNGNNTIIDTISAWTAPSPSNSTEYVILHTFTIPTKVEETTSVFLRLDLPTDQTWRNIGDSQLSIGEIGILFPVTSPTDMTTPTTIGLNATTIPTDLNITATTTPTTDQEPTTTIPPTTDNTDTTTPDDGRPTSGVTTLMDPMTVGFSGEPTCIGAGALAGAVVGGMMFPVIIVAVIVCVFSWYKKRRGKYHSNEEKRKSTEKNSHHQANGFIRNTVPRSSLSLPVHPSAVVTPNSATPTPAYGETPVIIDEREGLLPSFRNHGQAAGAMNLGYNRIPSRDSSSSSPHDRAVGPTNIGLNRISSGDSSSSSHQVVGAMNPGYNRFSSGDSNSPTTPYSETMQPLLSRDEPSAASAASTNIRIEAPGTSTESRVCSQYTTDEAVESHDHIYDVVRRPLPEIPEQSVHPVAHNSHQLYNNKNHLHNIMPKNKDISCEEVIIHALVKQIQSQNDSLNGYPDHPTTTDGVDDSIPVYIRPTDGNEMDLLPQSSAASGEMTADV